MISRSVLGYALVSGICLVLNNAVLIAMDWAGAPLPASVAVSFAIVVVVGYVLHSRVSFERALERAAFARYILAMSANIPLAFVSLWLCRDVAGLRMEFAAPLATGGMTLVNFLLCRFAVFGRRRTSPASGPTKRLAVP